jgi:hypothetical protein
VARAPAAPAPGVHTAIVTAAADPPGTPVSSASAAHPDRRTNRWPLLVLAAVCVAPVVASYVTYYALQPGGRTNYGTLVQPQRPLPALHLRALDGLPVEVGTLRGKWTLVQVDHAACAEACVRKLWNMRQVRLTTGREMERVQRAWLIVDDAPPDPATVREYDGTRLLRARPDELADFLELPPVPPEGPASQVTDHVWLIDPLGNLMLRWPRHEDPNRMKRDLEKLLRASRIG